jgi:hypothetical protein
MIAGSDHQFNGLEPPPKALDGVEAPRCFWAGVLLSCFDLLDSLMHETGEDTS